MWLFVVVCIMIFVLYKTFSSEDPAVRWYGFYFWGGFVLLTVCLSFLGPFVLVPGMVYIKWMDSYKNQRKLHGFLKKHSLPPYHKDDVDNVVK